MRGIGRGEHGRPRGDAFLGQTVVHVGGRQQPEATMPVLRVVPGEYLAPFSRGDGVGLCTLDPGHATVAALTSLRGFRVVGRERIRPGALSLDGTLWRLCCRLTDRRRVRRVPPPVPLMPVAAPLTEAACLDPLALADPTRLYPAAPPVRPECWETVEEVDEVERDRLTFPSPAPFGITASDRVTVHVYRPARGRALCHLPIETVNPLTPQSVPRHSYGSRLTLW